MSVWSIPALLMAGVTAYVGASHLLVYLRVRRDREQLAFAALCAVLAAYDLLCAGLYSAATAQEGGRWQFGQAFAACLGGMAFLWFVAEHLRAMTRRVLGLILGVGVPLLAAMALAPRSWLITDAPFVRTIALPLGLDVTYNEMAVGPLFTVENAMAFVVVGASLVLMYRSRRSPLRSRVLPLLVATAVFVAGVVSDVLVALGVYGFVYVVEYAFLAMVVLMAVRLSSDMLGAAEAERELAERERGHREVFNATGEAIFVHDAETGRIVDVNQAVLDLYGYTRDEVLSMTLADMSAHAPGFDEAAAREHVARASAQGRHVFEWVARTKAGRELWVEVALKVATLAGQRRVLAVVRDISDRKRAEQALRDSQRFNEMLVSALPGVVYIFDLVARRAVYANQSVGALLGYSPGEVAAMGEQLLAHLVHPDDMHVVANLLTRWDDVADEEVLTSEYRVRAKSGELRWWYGRDKVFKRGTDGRVHQIIGSAYDVTERHRAEQALVESEGRYRTLIEASPSGILLLDREGRLLFANPAARRIGSLGDAEDLRGLSIYRLVAPEDLRALQVRMRAVLSRAVEARPFRLRIVRPDGEVRHLELVGVRVLHEGAPAVLGVGHDVTAQVLAADERTRLEEQLRQAQKMEAVGLLAGGVAHDFNNLLQAILGHAEVLSSRVWDPQAVAAGLGELAEHARRGARLTRQLLVFSRREATRMEDLDLGTVVVGAADLVRRLLRESIVFEVNVANGPLPVHADRSQLEQVVMNLAVNGADAMAGGGVLSLRTGAGDDGRVWLEVSDTGHGIAEDIRDRVFEPFFTTKQATEGSGLGLSVVHAIVMRHGGSVELDTRVGAGTAFRIYLPRREKTQAQPGSGPAAEPEGQLRGDGRRVLVVEDEAGARAALVDILSMLGFEVVAMGTVAAARALPVELPFAALLCDVVLPDGVGNELAAELQARWPDLAVILMSGYAQDLVVRDAVSRGEVHFLQKPFGMSALSQELSRALGGAP